MAPMCDYLLLYEILSNWYKYVFGGSIVNNDFAIANCYSQFIIIVCWTTSIRQSVFCSKIIRQSVLFFFSQKKKKCLILFFILNQYCFLASNVNNK